MQPGRALITGAGKRLGREMALYLGNLGWDIAVHYASSKAEADTLVEELRAMGRTAEALQADLLIEAESQALVPAAAQALGGPLTLLINNASIFENDSLENATRESWDRHIESNLRAPFVQIQNFEAQAPKAVLDERKEPRARALVINMLDQRIHKLTPAFMSYTIAKMGLWALTQTAARAMAPDVRINGIGPGPTLQGTHQSDTHFARQRAATILERGSNPEDITAALGYFLNADGVTGQMLCTDGGQHLGWQTPDILGQE